MYGTGAGGIQSQLTNMQSNGDNETTHNPAEYITEDFLQVLEVG